MFVSSCLHLDALIRCPSSPCVNAPLPSLKKKRTFGVHRGRSMSCLRNPFGCKGVAVQLHDFKENPLKCKGVVTPLYHLEKNFWCVVSCTVIVSMKSAWLSTFNARALRAPCRGKSGVSKVVHEGKFSHILGYTYMPRLAIWLAVYEGHVATPFCH